MLRTTLLLAGVAASSAYMTAPVTGVSRMGRASLVSVRMGQASPPDSGKPLSLAKKNTLAANKAQWGIESVPPSPQTPSVASSAPAAAPAPKKAAAPAAAAESGATVGFSGVPSAFSRPGPTAFASESGQTFLGMGGPRAAGHREKFGGKHAATALALSTLLFQPILQAGNYNLPSAAGAPYTKASFESTLSKAPGFQGKVPTLDAFFPFAKNGFTTGPVLFSAESPIVFEKDLLGGCGAFNNKGDKCHTFFDEIGDLVTKKPETPARADVKGGFFLPWVWKK